MAHILLGVSGGIAAIKIPELVTALQKQGHTVSLVLTKGAEAFFSTDQLNKLDVPVYKNLFAGSLDPKAIVEDRSVEHIDLAKSADLLVIAPATANVIAKLSTGIADDYLTTLALAVTCPIIVCPAMNVNMWTHPATQKNTATLLSRGIQIVEPEEGMLACGDVGQGKLASLEVITEQINKVTKLTNQLKGKTVVVTAGGTTEPIDDVRFIANKSSGKMGVSLAEVAYQRGAQVILLRAKGAVHPRFFIEAYEFNTTEDLEELMKKYSPTADIVIHTAAVSDFSVKQHIGKLDSKKQTTIELTPRHKILDQIKKQNPNTFLIGFKAEVVLTDEELVAKATQRLDESNADMMVANHIDRPGVGFGGDDNEVFLVTKREKPIHIAKTSKREIAEKILDNVIPANAGIQSIEAGSPGQARG